MRKIPFLFLALLLFGCKDAPLGKFNVNVYQNGKAYKARNGPVTLERAPFDLVVSFPDVPFEVDTSLNILYWSTMDPEIHKQMDTATTLINIGPADYGTIAVERRNFSRAIWANIQDNCATMEIYKHHKGRLFTTFKNVDRHGNRLDGWHKVNYIWDHPTLEKTPISRIEGDRWMMYFSLRGDTVGGELEGQLVDIRFRD